MVQTIITKNDFNRASTLSLSRHNTCKFYMHQDIYKALKTKETRLTICTLALEAAFHSGLDPTQIYVRSPIHNTTWSNGHYTEDQWHVTASVKTDLYYSNQHQTMHCYTTSNEERQLTHTTITLVKDDHSPENEKPIWPKNLKKVPSREAPNYGSVRQDMIQRSRKDEKRFGNRIAECSAAQSTKVSTGAFEVDIGLG